MLGPFPVVPQRCSLASSGDADDRAGERLGQRGDALAETATQVEPLGDSLQLLIGHLHDVGAPDRLPHDLPVRERGTQVHVEDHQRVRAPETLDRVARDRAALRQAAEDDRARVGGPATQRFGRRDRVPGGRREDLVPGTARGVDAHAHETSRQVRVCLHEIRPDAVTRRSTQHFVAEPIVADATDHRHRRTGGAQMARDVERCAAQKETFRQGIPEDFTNTQDLGARHPC